MGKIVIGDIEIEVIKKKIKNINLVVYPDGRARISCPLKTNDKDIERLAISRIDWIKEKRLKFISNEEILISEYISGEKHYFGGEAYILNVIYGNFIPKVEIENNAYINLFVKEGSSKEKREQVLNDWYRENLKEVIPVFVKKWESIIGVEVYYWGIKNMKTRWGSCNIRDHRIWINLQLAKKTPECIECVVVHEMVHLLERGHNKRFYEYMDRFMPEWVNCKQELNTIMR